MPMEPMFQSKFIIFRIEHLSDGNCRLHYQLRGVDRTLTIAYRPALDWRLRLQEVDPGDEEPVLLDLECVGFRFEGDEKMYKYPIRYRDSNSRPGSKWPEADGVVLRDDLETERAIEAVFVPWKA